MENIPDGTFKGTAQGVIQLIRESASPIDTARELLELLRRSETEGKPELVQNSPLAKWLPNTPEKLAAYIGILIGVISVILQLLSQDPSVNIEYNQTFINQYNEAVQARPSQSDAIKANVSKKEFPNAGRNDMCPCGSGKKYKKCHGR